jgi:hypothetical protein
MQKVGTSLATNDTNDTNKTNDEAKLSASRGGTGQKRRLNVRLCSIRVIRVIRGCFFSCRA